MNTDTIEDGKIFQNWLQETLRLNGTPGELPTRLFKFMSCESKFFQLSIHELHLHSRIRLSSCQEFNDPFDSRPQLIDVSGDDAVDFVIGLHQRRGIALPADSQLDDLRNNPQPFVTKTNASLHRTLDKCGIYSMTSSVSHPLMWAHYGCSHRGLAIMFRHGTQDCKFGGFPVRYQGGYPTATICDMDDVIQKSLVKGEAWRYEKEWRIVEPNNARSWKELEPNAVVGVVFGVRCAQNDVDGIMELIARRATAGLPPLLVFRAEIAAQSFELNFLRLAANGWISASLP